MSCCFVASKLNQAYALVTSIGNVTPNQKSYFPTVGRSLTLNEAPPDHVIMEDAQSGCPLTGISSSRLSATPYRASGILNYDLPFMYARRGSLGLTP